MTQSLAAIALLVADYDQAIAYYTTVMGFVLLEVTPREPGKRWVRVAPPGSTGTCLLLARASTDAQRARIGDQTGGPGGLFLHTHGFMRDYRAGTARGAHVPETPPPPPHAGARDPPRRPRSFTFPLSSGSRS